MNTVINSSLDICVSQFIILAYDFGLKLLFFIIFVVQHCRRIITCFSCFIMPLGRRWSVCLCLVCPDTFTKYVTKLYFSIIIPGRKSSPRTVLTHTKSPSSKFLLNQLLKNLSDFCYFFPPVKFHQTWF